MKGRAMKTKLMALLVTAGSFVGCAQVEEVKEGMKAAPEDFWITLRGFLSFAADLIFGVALSWVRGLLGI